MTNEEAKIILAKVKSCDNNDILDCSDKGGCDKCEYDYSNSDFHEAIDVAMEALEKQAEYWDTVVDAYSRLEEIDRIVRREIGDRCEINQMILKVIRGKDK